MNAFHRRALALLAAVSGLLGGCAFNAPYRTTPLATSGAVSADELVVVTLSATEHRPGQRREFFRDTRSVLAVMPEQDGLLGYAVRFEILGKAAWTQSVWKDTAARDAFVRSPEHLAAVKRSAQTTQNTRFVTIERPLSSLPLRWDEVIALLRDAPVRQVDSPPLSR